MRKNYKFNKNFFSNINTEEKAYWYGFILADGCISRGKELILGLSAKDANHLKKFIKSLNGNNKIYIHNANTNFGSFSYCRLSIGCKKMIDDLKKYGMLERKSLIIKSPKLEKRLERHFWRGVIDGDGYLGITKQKYKNSIYNIFAIELTGNKNIIKSFLKYVHKNLHIRGKIFKDKNVFRSRFACAKGKLIVHLLYKNARICLERKLKIYKKI